jgi:shikimate kinase
VTSTSADAAPRTTRPRLVLVGPPGAGKSTVAALLAERWGVGHRDTDADVEAAAGKPIAEIFVDDGEAAFRVLERTAVAAALREHSGVLSVGGGAVTSAEVRALLASRTVVFLDVGLAEAAARVGLGTSRPLLLGNVRGRLKALLDERRPLYAAVATHTVVTDGRSPEEVAAEVEAAVADGTGR